MKESPNQLIELFQEILQRLENHSIPYMVVGSVASIIYGEPRMTNDMDVVIQVSQERADEFGDMFPEEKFYCPPLDVIQSEITSRGQFNVIHHESGLKVDFVVQRQEEHGREEFNRRRSLSFWEDFEANVAAPEDVIIGKLNFFRESEQSKHIEDIRGIMAHTDVDRDYLDRWIDRLGLQEIWDKVE